MDEQDRMLAETEVGRQVLEDYVNVEATHYAKTVAINKQKETGSKNDKMAKDR